MSTHSIRRRALFATLLTLSLSSAHASAQLLHEWDFENGAEFEDSAGSLDLNVAPGQGNVGGVTGTAADLVFEPGYNGGQAYRPYYVDLTQSSTSGVGLAGSGFTAPEQFTIEAIVKADQKTSAGAVNYLFQTRPGADRGYFLVQDETGLPPGSIGGIGTIIGDTFSDIAISAAYTSPGTWLYVAATIDLSNTIQPSIDTYVANLSLGETQVTQVLDDRTFNAFDTQTLTTNTGVFGIGGFAIDSNGDSFAEASQEWFQGAIDYIAIYDGLLHPAVLDRNLATRIAPEPGIALLLGLALTGLALAGGRPREASRVD